MKIGIIGSGNIGGNLGILLTKAGHEVLFSSRHPENLLDLIKLAGPRSCVGTISEAADFGEIVVLSIPFMGIDQVANAVKNLIGERILIDTCNPYPQRDGEIANKIINKINYRQTQYTLDLFPQARVVKAFNTIYFEHLRDLAFSRDEQRIGLPIAGNDDAAKSKVMKLIESIGFTPVDVGLMKDSELMEVNRLLYNKPMSADRIAEILTGK